MVRNLIIKILRRRSASRCRRRRGGGLRQLRRDQRPRPLAELALLEEALVAAAGHLDYAPELLDGRCFDHLQLALPLTRMHKTTVGGGVHQSIEPVNKRCLGHRGGRRLAPGAHTEPVETLEGRVARAVVVEACDGLRPPGEDRGEQATPERFRRREKFFLLFIQLIRPRYPH